jgi:hypothetical protein
MYHQATPPQSLSTQQQSDGFQDGTSKGLTIPFIAENDDDDNCDE